MNKCDQFRELIEAYALGALDAEERVAFDVHLATGCQDCLKAVGEARWLVSQLGYLAPDAGPSETVKSRLMQTVRSEARMAKSSLKPKTSIPFWMWAGVAALLVLSLYSRWDARRLQRDMEAANQRATAILQQRHELEAQLQLAKREARILTDPNSKKIMLPPKDAQMPHLEAMWHPELGLCLMGQKVYARASVEHQGDSHYRGTGGWKSATHQRSDVGWRGQLGTNDELVRWNAKPYNTKA